MTVENQIHPEAAPPAPTLSANLTNYNFLQVTPGKRWRNVGSIGSARVWCFDTSRRYPEVWPVQALSCDRRFVFRSDDRQGRAEKAREGRRAEEVKGLARRKDGGYVADEGKARLKREDLLILYERTKLASWRDDRR